MPKPQYRWPKGLREKILKRDGHRCKIEFSGLCTVKATAVDHIVPVVKGGAWFDPDNLRAACRTCNTALSNPQSKHHQKAAYRPSREW